MIFFFFDTVKFASASVPEYSLFSPDRYIKVIFSLINERVFYRVLLRGSDVLQQSKLGLIRDDEDFSQSLVLFKTQPVSVITDRYFTKNNKRHINSYKVNRRVFNVRNSAGKKMDIIFQVSNDRVAFRYSFPERTTDVKKITREITSYKLPGTAKAWLQPMAVPKSGWEKTNPSYKENYLQNI